MKRVEADARCSHLQRLLQAAATAEDAAHAQAISHHLAACPRCRAAEQVLTALIDQYQHLESPPLPDSLEARLLQKLCARP